MKVSDNEKIREASLAWIVLVGFAGGLILKFDALRASGDRAEVAVVRGTIRAQQTAPLALNVWYSLGLMSVFWVLAALAVTFGLGWGQLFSYSEFDVTLAAVVFTMGLSFLGVWEIPIPGFVGRGKTLELGEKEKGPRPHLQKAS